MKRWLDGYTRLLEATVVALLVLMVLLVFGNVVLRYGFNAGITVSEELSRWLFVWLTFLGAVIGLHERAHLGTDLLVSHLGPRGQRLCLALGQALMLYATWLLLRGAWEQLLINREVEAPITGASVAWFYGAGVVFAVSAGLILLRDLVRTVTGQLDRDEQVMVRESEDLAQVQALDLDRSQTFKKP